MRRLTDILIFVGPSGSGKSTLITHLLKQWPQYFAFCTSHTTREPRQGEIAGKDYHFIPKETFRHMIGDKAFVEYSRVFCTSTHKSICNNNNNNNNNNINTCNSENYNNCNKNSNTDVLDEAHYYGTSRAELQAVLSQNKVALMDTDIKGAINIKKYCSDSVIDAMEKNTTNNNNNKTKLKQSLRVKIILIQSPGVDVLEQRLRQRGSETSASLQKRLCESRKWMDWYKANPNFFDCTLLNDKLDVCLDGLENFVMKKVLAPASML